MPIDLFPADSLFITGQIELNFADAMAATRTGLWNIFLCGDIQSISEIDIPLFNAFSCAIIVTVFSIDSIRSECAILLVRIVPIVPGHKSDFRIMAPCLANGFISGDAL